MKTLARNERVRLMVLHLVCMLTLSLFTACNDDSPKSPQNHPTPFSIPGPLNGTWYFSEARGVIGTNAATNCLVRPMAVAQDQSKFIRPVTVWQCGQGSQMAEFRGPAIEMGIADGKLFIDGQAVGAFSGNALSARFNGSEQVEFRLDITLNGDSGEYREEGKVQGNTVMLLTGKISRTATVQPNQPPRALGDAASVVSGSELSLVLKGRDLETDNLTYRVISGPFHGTVSGTPPSLTYRPTSGFTGQDQLSFVVNDGQVDSTSATILITVAAPDPADAPRAFDQNLSVRQSRSLAVTLNATDPHQKPLSYAIVAGPQHGSLTGTAPSLTYQPTGNYTGDDSFTFKVSNGVQESNIARISIRVKLVPIAYPLSFYTYTGNSTRAWFAPPGSSSLVTYRVVTGPAHGTLSGTLPALTYTPAAGFFGEDSYTYAVTVSGEESDPGVVRVSVDKYDVPAIAGTFADSHCAMNAAGAVRCWGDNQYGQTGNGGTSFLQLSQANSVALGTGHRATAIAHGRHHVCALLENGSVKCWGRNQRGQLGLGDLVNRGDNSGEMGNALPAVNLGSGRTALAISAVDDTSCALLDNRRVKCWGGDEIMFTDVAGIGGRPEEMGDNLAALPIAGNRTVRTLQGHCAILSDGSATCWDNFLEIAPGTSLASLSLGTGRTVRKIASGATQNCFILDNNQVKCVPFGQGTDTGDALPAVDLGSNLIPSEIALGYSHACVLFTNGKMKCWGSNSSMQLGSFDTRNDLGDEPGEMGNALPFVDLGAGKTAIRIMAYYNDTCAQLNDRSLKCWGGSNSWNYDFMYGLPWGQAIPTVHFGVWQ